MNHMRWILAIIVVFSLTAPARAATTLSDLQQAAVRQDDWLQRSRLLERAFDSDALAAGQLPDPRISVSLANIPTDTFDFSQEPTTQLIVGMSQVFPAGKSRGLSRERLATLADLQPIEREVRIAGLQRSVAETWLDACLAELTIRLIAADRGLFEQLVQVTQSRYRSATRRVRQQDLIRAQLELTALDERVLKLSETRDRGLEKLKTWVPAALLTGAQSWALPTRQPVAAPPPTQLIEHPEIRLIDQRIAVARVEIDLAKQSRRAGFTVNTSSGVRDEDRFGRELPDFVSLGVTMNLPWFRRSQHEQSIDAAAFRTSALESARLTRLSELGASLQEAATRLSRLGETAALYDTTLLAQMDALSLAALNAYTSDQGDFADVMRAYIAQLNARIEALRIAAEQQKVIVQLDYLTTTSVAEVN